MAKRMPSILPPFSIGEALETTKIHSVAGKLEGNTALMSRRPFRSPHHTISDVALVGGGTYPQPGEISLAHNGVLFLDELPEFNRSVLEVMRQPLEDRRITISRAKFSVEYPASFMLVSAMNPCPWRILQSSRKSLRLSARSRTKIPEQNLGTTSRPHRHSYRNHSGTVRKISDKTPAEHSAAIRERVIMARKIQEERFKDIDGIYCNAQMTSKMLQKYASPDEAGLKLLKRPWSA